MNEVKALLMISLSIGLWIRLDYDLDLLFQIRFRSLSSILSCISRLSVHEKHVELADRVADGVHAGQPEANADTQLERHDSGNADGDSAQVCEARQHSRSRQRTKELVVKASEPLCRCLSRNCQDELDGHLQGNREEAVEDSDQTDNLFIQWLTLRLKYRCAEYGGRPTP